MLTETMVEGDLEVEDPLNAKHFDDTKRRAPRSYGLISAYARIWLWSLAALGVAFGASLLARAI